MSELAVENTPDVAEPAHEAARGQVVYITKRGERVAAIIPTAVAAELERLSADELDELAASRTRPATVNYRGCWKTVALEEAVRRYGTRNSSGS